MMPQSSWYLSINFSFTTCHITHNRVPSVFFTNKNILKFYCHSRVSSDLIGVFPDQAVDLIIGCALGVRGVTVCSQSCAGVPVASQTLLIQVNVNSGLQLENKNL